MDIKQRKQTAVDINVVTVPLSLTVHEDKAVSRPHTQSLLEMSLVAKFLQLSGYSPFIHTKRRELEKSEFKIKILTSKSTHSLGITPLKRSCQLLKAKP